MKPCGAPGRNKERVGRGAVRLPNILVLTSACTPRRDQPQHTTLSAQSHAAPVAMRITGAPGSGIRRGAEVSRPRELGRCRRLEIELSQLRRFVAATCHPLVPASEQTVGTRTASRRPN